MSYYSRPIKLDQYLHDNKVVVIYGARQVGKTTFIKKFLSTYKKKSAYYTGDDLEFSEAVSKCSLEIFKKMFTGLSLIVIDEAQKVENIGRAVKLIVDNMDNIKFILTGSSSFNLANKTGESLTGRKVVLTLYPISQKELLQEDTQFRIEKNLPENLVYGAYPAVLTAETYNKKEEKLREMVNSYLLKDIFAFNLVKNSKPIRDLLKLLAFQIGSEASLNELASSLEIDKNTVARYIDLLEKSFVLFSLGGFSRNLRKEVYKSQKYYFYDLGIRNSLIANLNPIDLRNDIGQLWENFLVMERIKRNAYSKNYPNYYFWRTYDKKEIDFIEEKKGKLSAYEFKWSKSKVSSPEEFLDTYKNSCFKVITKDDYFEFVDYRISSQSIKS
jgi:uncharacterized protein